MSKRLPKLLRPDCNMRSRKSLINFINHSGDGIRSGDNYEARPYEQYSRGPWRFCWNVKVLYPIDTSFDCLLKISGYRTASQAWIDAARKVYDETDGNAAYDHTIERIVEDFTGRDGRPDDDAYNMVYDGTPVNTRFAFLGRSGGYLCLTGYNGEAMTVEGWEDAATRWEIPTLRHLAEYLQFVTRACTRKAVTENIQYQMADHLFEIACAGIKTPMHGREQLSFRLS